jgi:hypothetical protein
MHATGEQQQGKRHADYLPCLSCLRIAMLATMHLAMNLWPPAFPALQEVA